MMYCANYNLTLIILLYLLKNLKLTKIQSLSSILDYLIKIDLILIFYVLIFNFIGLPPMPTFFFKFLIFYNSAYMYNFYFFFCIFFLNIILMIYYTNVIYYFVSNVRSPLIFYTNRSLNKNLFTVVILLTICICISIFFKLLF